MDPTLDKLYAALDQADAAGETQDAQDIASLIREHKAKRSGAKPAQPGQTQKVAAPNLDMTPSRKAEDQNSDGDILRGLDRLPNLVGLGNVSTGFTKADVDVGEAWKRLGTGAVVAPTAAVVAAGDAFTLGGATRLAGMLPGSSYEKAQAAKQQLMDAAPGSAQLVGDLAGYGLGGTALSKIPGSVAGLTTKGIGVQSGLMAGGSALVQDPTDLGGAALEAGIGVAGGKLLQGVGDTIVKPLAQKYLPKIERALTGNQKVRDANNDVVLDADGKPQRVRDTDEFKIPEAIVQRVANRTKMPVDEIKANLAEFAAVHGPDSPRFLSLVNAETAGAFRSLSKAKSGANAVFREGEEAASLARPDVVGRAVGRTGTTKSAISATEDVIAQGDDAIAGVTAKADDIKTRLNDRLTTQTRELDDAATAQTRAIDAEGAATRRMVRDETDALKTGERVKIAEAGAALSKSLQERAAGIKPDEVVKKELAKYTRLVFRGGKTADGTVVKGMADKPVNLPKGWLQKNFPEDPKTITAVLKAKAETLPKGKARARLNKAIESMSGGKDGGPSVMKLTLGDVDSIRRALKKPVDVAGVKYNLTEIGTALRDFAATKHPTYKSDYLEVFENTMKSLEARVQGAKAVGKSAVEGADNIAAGVADEATALGRMAVRQGSRDAALKAISGTTKDGAQALQSAAVILRNADAIERLAGREGAELVKVVRAAMKNVQKIKEEIADITAAARTTREGVADDVVRSKQGVTDATTAAKRELTDVQKDRLKKLERTAKAQLDIIKQAMSKNTRAIDAAARVMNMTESELAAATAGSTQPLDQVARGAIQGRATQSPADAIKVVEDLATPSTGRKIAQVAGQETGDALQKVGETQRREIANLSAVAARKTDDDVVGEELSLAMEASAALLGRAGPGYQTAILKRGANSLGELGVSNKAAKAIAEAVMRQDKAYVEKLINRLAKTERQRKVMAEAIRAWVVGSITGAVEDVR